MQRQEKGAGTIVQRESGTWSGRVSIGRDFDGKIKYKYLFKISIAFASLIILYFPE